MKVLLTKKKTNTRFSLHVFRGCVHAISYEKAAQPPTISAHIFGFSVSMHQTKLLFKILILASWQSLDQMTDDPTSCKSFCSISNHLEVSERNI